ncbi:MAG: hypothetical protein ACERKZ_20640 [Lachnotalea sp.]
MNMNTIKSQVEIVSIQQQIRSRTSLQQVLYRKEKEDKYKRLIKKNEVELAELKAKLNR